MWGGGYDNALDPQKSPLEFGTRLLRAIGVQLGLHFGSKKTRKIVDSFRGFVEKFSLFRIEVKPLVQGEREHQYLSRGGGLILPRIWGSDK